MSQDATTDRAAKAIVDMAKIIMRAHAEEFARRRRFLMACAKAVRNV